MILSRNSHSRSQDEFFLPPELGKINNFGGNSSPFYPFFFLNSPENWKIGYIFPNFKFTIELKCSDNATFLHKSASAKIKKNKVFNKKIYIGELIQITILYTYMCMCVCAAVNI